MCSREVIKLTDKKSVKVLEVEQVQFKQLDLFV